MGNRSRALRSKVKAALRLQGWYENELGELKKKMSKREARERLLFRGVFEHDIVDQMAKKAIEDIQAHEDRVFLQMLENATNPPPERS